MEGMSTWEIRHRQKDNKKSHEERGNENMKWIQLA
jgi:hypothetical protein